MFQHSLLQRSCTALHLWWTLLRLAITLRVASKSVQLLIIAAAS